MTPIYRPARGPLGARLTLTRFVREQAVRTTEELGFGWVASETAPATHQQLRGAFAHSERTAEPLPVSSLFCDNTIYVEPSANVCFRFWHDTNHVQQGLSFSLEDEWELALWHLEQLAVAGLGPDSREHQLLRQDLVGQIILLSVGGRFPFNQADFTSTCGELGLDAGILAELRRMA